jgi:hypothetical protein
MTEKPDAEGGAILQALPQGAWLGHGGPRSHLLQMEASLVDFLWIENLGYWRLASAQVLLGGKNL